MKDVEIIENEKSSLYIDTLVISEEYRHKGIGTMIIEYFKEYAKKEEIDNITLKVNPNNEKAISFYKKNGMKVELMTMRVEMK